jgi:glycosyltransferase involved in cell wall biosynthesis
MKRIYAFLFLMLTVCLLEAKQPTEAQRPQICLNMIVKNESHVICRCLESVKPLIDYWVIVDTGSTDGTQKIIKDFMKDIPGELHERPWVNFEHNRNEALSFARDKADYLLFIDADDTLSYEPDFKRPTLDHEAYYMKIRYGGMTYDRIQLIRNTPDWSWVGVVHEVLVSPHMGNAKMLDGVKMVIVGGGDRSHDPKKFLKDALLLENALKDDPTNARYTFYLAQSYRDAEMPEQALKVYQKRVEMGGWDQEVYCSLLQIARLQEELNMPEDVVSKGYYKAYQFRPTRAEPLYQLANYYRRKDNYLLGYLISSFALKIKEPSDVLFVESWIHEFGLLLENSICSYWLGNYRESLDTCNLLLSNQDLPDYVKDCVEKNKQFALDKLEVKQPENNAA